MTGADAISTQLLQDYRAARLICRRHARSFYFASHFLPRPKRDHAYAVYAFCRLLDDEVDEAGGGVGRFLALLDVVYDDAASPAPPADPALRAFAHTARACDIPKQLFLDLADGCRMDLTVARYATWADLERYCYRVAGVVGLMMCHVFGVTDPAARGRAVAMGNAMQLTNILRDVKEDLDRGRLYLPAEDLARFGVSEASLATGRVDPSFVELMRFEIARARALYQDGAAGLCAIPNDGSRFTAAAMAVVYAGILGAIERRRYEVFAGRARVPLWRKLLRLTAARRLARREAGEPVPGVFAS